MFEADLEDALDNLGSGLYTDTEHDRDYSYQQQRLRLRQRRGPDQTRPVGESIQRE